MSIDPFTGAFLVQKQLGAAYETVKGVSSHISEITRVYNSIEDLDAISDNIDVFNDRIETRIREAPFETSSTYEHCLLVRKDDSGDYTDVGAALNAASGSTAAIRYLIDIGDGIFPVVEGFPRSFTDMRGKGKAHTYFTHYQADNTSLATIASTSAFTIQGFVNISDIDVTTANTRYAVHSDTGGTNTDIFVHIVNCTFTHYGNEGARIWHQANGGNGASVWVSTDAVALGTASGQRWDFCCTDFDSWERNAFSAHNNVDFAKGSELHFNNCRFVSRVTRAADSICGAITLLSLGSRRDNLCEINNSNISGAIIQGPFPWISTDPEDQIADKIEWRIRGSGNESAPYLYLDDGSRALRIDNTDTSVEGTIEIDSGSAGAIALLGPVTNVWAGGGMPSGKYGKWDVGDHPVGIGYDTNITKMGYRLGNCTTVNKILGIARNGVYIPVVFNQNHTNQSNTTILAFINAALGANAVASLYDVSSTYFPEFLDEESAFLNNSGSLIRRKTGCAYSTLGRAIRPMTSTDAASLFAGVALEDIRDGEWGRVKTRGVIHISSRLDRSDGAAVAFGDTLGIGATPGRFVKSATIPLMKALNTVDALWEKRFAL